MPSTAQMAAAAAKKFRDDLAAEAKANATAAPAAGSQPASVVQTTGGSEEGSLAAAQAAANTASAPAALPAAVDLAAALAPSAPAAQAPAAPDIETLVSARVAAEIAARDQGFDLERQEFQRQLAQAQAAAESNRVALEAAETERRSLAEAARAAEAAKMFDVDLSGLEHVDTAVAREVTDKVLKPVLTRMQQQHEAQMSALNDQLRTREAAAAAGLSTVQQTAEVARRAAFNNSILANVKEVAEMHKSPAFATWRDTVIPYTETTFGAALAQAYNAENLPQVVALLNAAKTQITATPAAAAAVASSQPLQVASRPAEQAASFAYSDLETWRNEKRMGLITSAEYSERMKKFKEAEAAGLVA